MTKTNKTTAILALFLLLPLALAWGVELEERGFQVRNQRTDDGIALYDVVSPNGIELTLGGAEEFTNEQINIVNIVLDTVGGLDRVEIEDLTIVFRGGVAEIVLVPSSFVYDGIELADYMPSGMQFFYTSFLEYDFRMLVDELFVRVSGQYFSEQQFAERLVRVVRNPEAFIRSQDPEFLRQRIDELENRLGQLENNLRRALEEAQGRISELETASETLEDEQGSLSANLVDVAENFALLRYAVLILNNRGLFGGIRMPPDEAIERAVALKRSNPELTADEAQAALAEEGVDVSNNEIFLIFAIYFNDFE
jgi:hypothetical protein